MTKQETILVLQSIEDRAVNFPNMTECDWVAIAAAKRHLQEELANRDLKEKCAKQHDAVNHPSHYTWLKKLCGIEVIDITRHLDFDKGNAVKYLLRSGYKEEEGMSVIEKEIEDLRKAAWYIEDKIKMLQSKL